MNSLLLLQPLSPISSSLFLMNSGRLPSLFSVKPPIFLHSKPLCIPFFALTESSDSSPSIDPSSQSLLLLQLSDSLNLPSDYLEKLPRDLRLDLNDAAFDLSNGPVLDECGQELGELLLNLSRAWEKADALTSHALASKLPILEGTLTNNSKAALGKRLLSAGRRFQSMGLYGQGEMRKVAEAMITAGKLLSASPVSTAAEEPKEQTRVFKFGELQVAVTPEKANIGAIIGVVFGLLSWQLAQGIQSIPESSLQYANDNALLLAKSLRVALLLMFYSSTFLSSFTSVGLFLLARQLMAEKK